MSFVVRLRVKLVDERGEFEEGRPRKIIYGLNPYRHKLIRDVRGDLAVKVGVDVEQHDLEIWVDDYVVPGYTSSLVLKEDEEVLVKIVTKGLNEQTEPPDAFVEEEMLMEEAPAVEVEETTNGAAPAAAKPAPVAPAQPARSAAPRAAATAYPASWPRKAAPTASPQMRAPGQFAPRGMMMMNAAGHPMKSAMQCFFWDNPTHAKGACRFWHPRELCRHLPMCSMGARNCGFAHPFCSTEYCECPPKARDLQMNHRFRSAQAEQAAQEFAAETY